MASSSHTVRIIAGQYRRRLLPVPTVQGLRPTPDRVRQTVFNWLDHFLGNWAGVQVVDAFAGTGALGLEAASRGAAQVLLCEQHPQAVRSLQATVQLLGAGECTVRAGDALATLAQLPPASMDVVLLDPPFHADWVARLYAPVTTLVKPLGLVYIESEQAVQWDGYTVLRHLKAGAVHAQLLQRHNAATA